MVSKGFLSGLAWGALAFVVGFGVLSVLGPRPTVERPAGLASGADPVREEPVPAAEPEGQGGPVQDRPAEDLIAPEGTGTAAQQNGSAGAGRAPEGVPHAIAPGAEDSVADALADTSAAPPHPAARDSGATGSPGADLRATPPLLVAPPTTETPVPETMTPETMTPEPLAPEPLAPGTESAEGQLPQLQAPAAGGGDIGADIPGDTPPSPPLPAPGTSGALASDAPGGDIPPRLGGPEPAGGAGLTGGSARVLPQPVLRPGLLAPDLPSVDTGAPAAGSAPMPGDLAADAPGTMAEDAPGTVAAQARDAQSGPSSHGVFGMPDVADLGLPDSDTTAPAGPETGAVPSGVQSGVQADGDAPVAELPNSAARENATAAGQTPGDGATADAVSSDRITTRQTPAAPTEDDTIPPAGPSADAAPDAAPDSGTDPASDPSAGPAGTAGGVALPPQPGFTPFEGVRTNRLPVVGGVAPEDPTEATEAAEAVEAVEDNPGMAGFDLSLPAYLRYALPFANPDDLPLMAIILLDDGLPGATRDLIADLPFPLTMAVDPTLPDAGAVAQAYRDSGKEVVALATAVPARATAADIDVTLGSHLAALPQAVAVMDLAGGGFQGSRSLSQLIVPVLAQDGHGLITFDRGLNAAAQVAQSAGLAQVRVFRDLDDAAPNAFVLRRYLDRAVFEAARDGRVVVLGRGRHAPTLEAIISWRMEGRASDVALAPVSATLRGE